MAKKIQSLDPSSWDSTYVDQMIAQNPQDDKYKLGVTFNFQAGDDEAEQFLRNVDLKRVTSLVVLDLNEECEYDLRTNNGHIIAPFQGIRKDLVNPDGLFSPKFGTSLRDSAGTPERYRCECTDGNGLKGREFLGRECPRCGSVVKKVEDNFSYTGWMVLRNYNYIHPLMYNKLASFFGKETFENMITYKREQTIDGQILPYEFDPNKPYENVGMLYFEDHFDEIIRFFLKKKPNKARQYKDIMADRNKIFTHCIPVFTAMLRPIDEDGRTLYHEASNSKFQIINKDVTVLNDRLLNFNDIEPIVEQHLLHLQQSVGEIVDYLIDGLKGKKGGFRQLFAGRYNMTSRAIIVPDNKLRTDEVLLSYKTLVVWLEPQITNVLISEGCSPLDASEIVLKATSTYDEKVVRIINSIIKRHPSGRGLPVIINRNPSLKLGNILQMYCIGMKPDYENDYTMAIPEVILPKLAGDFDGDALNILFIINSVLEAATNIVFNPRNNMRISQNTGLCDSETIHNKDTIVLACSIWHLGKNFVSPEAKERKRALADKYDAPPQFPFRLAPPVEHVIAC